MVLVLQAASSIQAYVLAFETMTEISLLALGKDNLVFGMVIFKSTTFAGLALQPPPLKWLYLSHHDIGLETIR